MTLIHQQVIKGFGLELKPVTLDDIEQLRQWRNSDRVRLQMHDQSIIAKEQQQKWFAAIQTRDNEAYWVVYFKHEAVGCLYIKSDKTLGLGQTVDVGMYTGNSAVKHGLLGFAMAIMQISIVFEKLTIAKISMEVKLTNTNVIKFNTYMGYKVLSRENGFAQMEITTADFIQTKKRLARYFPDQTVTYGDS